jgi:hypothetical protein
MLTPSLKLLDELLYPGFGDGWLGIAPSESPLPLLGILVLILYALLAQEKMVRTVQNHCCECSIPLVDYQT